jgi:hypothetical protein
MYYKIKSPRLDQGGSKIRPGAMLGSKARLSRLSFYILPKEKPSVNKKKTRISPGLLIR